MDIWTCSDRPLEIDDARIDDCSSPDPLINTASSPTSPPLDSPSVPEDSQYRFQDGRRYLSGAHQQYSLPHDELEEDRLDLQHGIFQLTASGLYIAPISAYSTKHVLDVGCGYGQWAIEFANQHPSTLVLGIDVISAMPPCKKPSNCSFAQASLEPHLPQLTETADAKCKILGDVPWDFIHARAMSAAIQDWPSFVQEAFRTLRPGGYLELQDLSFVPRALGSVNIEETFHARWCSFFVEGQAKDGHDLRAPEKWVKWLQDAGFVDIHVRTYNWPIGSWAKGDKMKALGRMVRDDFLAAEMYPKANMMKHLGFTSEEADEFLDGWEKELKEQKFCLYMTPCFCFARKPED